MAACSAMSPLSFVFICQSYDRAQRATGLLHPAPNWRGAIKRSALPASRLELPRVVCLELSPRCCEKTAPRRILKIHYRGDKEERQYNVLPVSTQFRNVLFCAI